MNVDGPQFYRRNLIVFWIGSDLENGSFLSKGGKKDSEIGSDHVIQSCFRSGSNLQYGGVQNFFFSRLGIPVIQKKIKKIRTILIPEEVWIQGGFQEQNGAKCNKTGQKIKCSYNVVYTFIYILPLICYSDKVDKVIE